ncbi:MAG: patatin-like phospholipase family protein [Alphaproteobacteria bacterium]|nr:patatin-like phospholipase family protein [Alphaproteobacteria bacterium]MBV8412794.1 patatin-like phospholipase family protein [Alphaproteobacteria bacterium]
MPDSSAEGKRRDLRPSKRRINIALQGGGAHGAFAWGVLDRLLEDDRLEIEGIVGTSAGAMNAVVTAYGLTLGGGAGARERLCAFWRSVSDAARFSMLQPTFWDKALQPDGSLDFAPGYILTGTLSRLLSPYQLNPGNINPLRDVLLSVVDFERLRRNGSTKLFVCASNVMSGRLRVFDKAEISVDAVLASACLPFMFQAVAIDGEHYWDGGYMGNPPIFPLIYNCETRDVLIIQLDPINIDRVPTTANEIRDRLITLSFNSSLMREMRAIHFVEQLIASGFDSGGKLKSILVHTIDGEDVLKKLSVSSKMNPDWEFLTHLFDIGRQRADRFLAQNFDQIGVQSSTDIQAKFL